MARHRHGERSLVSQLSEQERCGCRYLSHILSNGETSVFCTEDASFGFLFAQATPFTVSAGETRMLKYRVLAYTGDLFTFDVWGYHQDYIG